MSQAFAILLHSSKTMRHAGQHKPHHAPRLLSKAQEINAYLQSLSVEQLSKGMHISPSLAAKTRQLIAGWNTQPEEQSPAIDSFVGDIYSGLQAATFSEADRDYADEVLYIFSGLYGVLRPLDGVFPYRLEMGYKLPGSPWPDLYTLWGKQIVDCLPTEGPVINVSSLEYSRTVTPFIDPARIITPRFLSIDPKTQEPTFVVVHAKIARGAFAHWLIKTRTTHVNDLANFDEIGYAYDSVLSTPAEPVFVCQEFGGKGLSMRLAK